MGEIKHAFCPPHNYRSFNHSISYENGMQLALCMSNVQHRIHLREETK
jgi:hypothetical protein